MPSPPNAPDRFGALGRRARLTGQANLAGSQQHPSLFMPQLKLLLSRLEMPLNVTLV